MRQNKQIGLIVNYSSLHFQRIYLLCNNTFESFKPVPVGSNISFNGSVGWPILTVLLIKQCQYSTLITGFGERPNLFCNFQIY